MTIKPSLIFSVRGLGKRLSARSSHIELPNYVEQFVERQAELKKNLLSVEREADKKMGSLFFPRGQPPAPGPQGGGPAKQPRNRPFSYEKVFGFFRARPGGGRGSAGCAPGTGPRPIGPPNPPKNPGPGPFLASRGPGRESPGAAGLFFGPVSKTNSQNPPIPMSRAMATAENGLVRIRPKPEAKKLKMKK